MSYPLESLLNLHKHRETLAQRKLQTQRALLKQAEAEERHCHELWQDFAAQRPKQEEACFSGIQHKEIPQQDLEKFFAHIASLRTHELALHDEAIAATQNREQAQALLDELLEAHRQCLKNVQKFHEHREVWRADAQKKAADAEEKELEDIRYAAKDYF